MAEESKPWRKPRVLHIILAVIAWVLLNRVWVEASYSQANAERLDTPGPELLLGSFLGMGLWVSVLVSLLEFRFRRPVGLLHGLLFAASLIIGAFMHYHYSRIGGIRPTAWMPVGVGLILVVQALSMMLSPPRKE